MSDTQDQKPADAEENETEEPKFESKFEERPDMPGVPWLKSRPGKRYT